MRGNPADLETLSFFGLVPAFEAWERLRPARRISRLAGLRLDLLSFALAMLMARASRQVMDSLIEAAAPGFLLRGLEAARAWPGWLRIAVAVAIVIVDFIIYWIHRGQHRLNFLWRTHQWHHSIEHMDWFAGFRTSFLHSLLYNIPRTLIPMQLLHLSPLEAGMGWSIALVIQFREHTNVRVKIGPLKYIFITAQYHRVHHAATPTRT